MGLPLQSIETVALVVVDAVQQNMAIRSQWKNLLLDVLCLLSFFFLREYWLIISLQMEMGFTFNKDNVFLLKKKNNYQGFSILIILCQLFSTC